VVAIGMSWLCFLPVDGSYLVHVLPSMLVMPIGYGMSFAPIYAAATSGVPARQGGLASGLITTSQQMGGAVGLAVLSGIAASFTASRIDDSAPQALTSGYELAMAVAVGFAVLAAAVAASVIRVATDPPRPRRRKEPS
jgi:MFS family permease